MATPQTAALAAPLVNGLRSVQIGVPDAALAEKFYVDTWHLSESTALVQAENVALPATSSTTARYSPWSARIGRTDEWLPISPGTSAMRLMALRARSFTRA